MMRLLSLAAATIAILALPAAALADHITSDICGGSGVLKNQCPDQGQELFARYCLGLDGETGKKAFKVQAGKTSAPLSVPLNSTVSWNCGSPPPDVCPGDIPVDLTTCESDFDDGIFQDVIQTIWAELDGIPRYQASNVKLTTCIFEVFEPLTPKEKGELLDAAIKPYGDERAKAVQAWYDKVIAANPTMTAGADACNNASPG